jgi:aspartate racemase
MRRLGGRSEIGWKNCASPISRRERSSGPRAPSRRAAGFDSHPNFPEVLSMMIAPRHNRHATAQRLAPSGRAETTVQRLFELQAARTPHATALVFNGSALTYGELNERADAFAAKLSRLGVGAEALVAVSAERSLEQITAVLAVLKAGGAYVPLDPAYPDDRLAAILEDARPLALITQQQLLGRLSSFHGPVVLLEPESFGGAAPGGPDGGATGENLAYAIFTSGSTGKPKGVLIEHRSLANHALATARHFELGPEDRVLQFASLSFDVAAEEIYPTWVSGGTVVLWPVSTGVAPVRSFVEFVDDNRITVLNLPAPYWHEWVNELARVGIPPKVRLVIAGSDKVSSEKFSVWRRYAGSRVRFCAAYGPTEGTITATVFDPAPGFSPSADCLPIGKPIANAEVHVLDESMRNVADGEAGELYIGGIGLARGYLNQAALTAERFVENHAAPGARLYKTGDLGRRMPDGNIEFLGRADDQLKIRGFRIELGEIESVLRQHPAARNVVVIGRDAGAGEKKLVAYVVVSNDNRPTSEDLRRFLKTRLPEYMVPAAFVMLKSLPLTPGGKVDRRQLPAPEIERDGAERAYVAARNETERQLVAIWEEMLEVRPIGIRDNFFELGGHSLMDARLVAQVERRMGVTVPLATIYHTRTVENLAALVERKRSSEKESLLQPYRTTGERPPVFSHGGSTHLANYLGEDQPIYWLDHHGTTGLAVPDTIEEMAVNYIREIRAVRPRGPYYLIGYCIGAVIMLEVARRLRATGEAVGLLCLIDPVTPRNMAGLGKPAASTPGAVAQRTALAARLKYLGGQVPRRYRWLKRISKRAFCDLWLRSGRRLPVGWRDFYCDEKLSRALERYAPDPYAGSFVIFRQPNNGTQEGWRAFAQGQVDFHDTWVDHNELLEEPYVQILAGELKSRLHQAQAENPAGRRDNASGGALNGSRGAPPAPASGAAARMNSVQ